MRKKGHSLGFTRTKTLNGHMISSHNRLLESSNTIIFSTMRACCVKS